MVLPFCCVCAMFLWFQQIESVNPPGLICCSFGFLLTAKFARRKNFTSGSFHRGFQKIDQLLQTKPSVRDWNDVATHVFFSFFMVLLNWWWCRRNRNSKEFKTIVCIGLLFFQEAIHSVIVWLSQGGQNCRHIVDSGNANGALRPGQTLLAAELVLNV